MHDSAFIGESMHKLAVFWSRDIISLPQYLLHTLFHECLWLYIIHIYVYICIKWGYVTYMYMFSYTCACFHMYVEAGGWCWVSYSVALHFIFWHRVSLRTWESSVWLYCLVNELQVAVCLQLLILGWETCPTMSRIYVGAENLTSTLRAGSSHLPLLQF